MVADCRDFKDSVEFYQDIYYQSRQQQEFDAGDQTDQLVHKKGTFNLHTQHKETKYPVRLSDAN